jgi:hypothetical protein
LDLRRWPAPTRRSLATRIPPKLSEFGPRRNPDRSKVWGCVLGNLVLPGLGTFAAGRRLSGIVQLIVSQTGFVLMVVWALSYARDWIQSGSRPESITPLFKYGLTGCVLFLLAWIWSVASSVGILQDSRKAGL